MPYNLTIEDLEYFFADLVIGIYDCRVKLVTADDDIARWALFDGALLTLPILVYEIYNRSDRVFREA